MLLAGEDCDEERRLMPLDDDDGGDGVPLANWTRSDRTDWYLSITVVRAREVRRLAVLTNSLHSGHDSHVFLFVERSMCLRMQSEQKV